MKLQRVACWVLLGGCLAMGAGCKRSETPKPTVRPQVTSPATPAVTATTVAPGELLGESKRPGQPQVDWRALLEQQGPPSLVTLDEVEGRCEWSVLRPPQLEGRVFMISHLCPESLVWDRRGGATAFALEGIVYLHDWQKATVDELAAPPMAKPEFGFSASGKLLACEYSNRESEEGGYVATYRKTFERQTDGTWQQIAYEQLKDEVPCSGVDSGEQEGELDYNPRYLGTTQCPAREGSPQGQPGPACPSQALFEAAQARWTGEDDPFTGFEFMGLSAKSFLTYRVRDADRVFFHLTPVIAIENDVVTDIYPRQPPDTEVDVLLGTDHFLVRTANTMTHAMLFKKGRVEPVKEFADDTRVFWIPGTLPTADVIQLQPEGSGDEDG